MGKFVIQHGKFRWDAHVKWQNARDIAIETSAGITYVVSRRRGTVYNNGVNCRCIDLLVECECGDYKVYPNGKCPRCSQD